jgi:sugar phosphate isomerase/epimerase
LGKKTIMNRRFALKSIGAVAALLPTQSIAKLLPANRLRTSLNAFSFNNALMARQMNLFQVLDFCVAHNFDAVDLTGYYFPGYPAVPADDYIYKIKNKATRLGLDISGTGVRTDFTNPDPAKRQENITLVKNWIEVAAKLGAPCIRIFAGAKAPDGANWQQMADRIIGDFGQCINHGRKHGVIVAVQNHNDFLQTAQHIHYFFEKINDPWFGLIMDTGGFRQADTYADTADTIKYAVNWQIKEKIFVNNIEMDTDIKRLLELIKASDYQGYIPIETLGAGDPVPKIEKLMTEIRKYL